jgi:hypothetical protein
MANEYRIAWHELGFDEFEVALFDFLRKLLTADRMLEHIHQMDGIRAKLRGVMISPSSAIRSWKRLRKQTATAPLQRACLGSPSERCVIRLRNIQRTALMCHHPAA